METERVGSAQAWHRKAALQGTEQRKRKRYGGTEDFQVVRAPESSHRIASMFSKRGGR
jgi:hypothetical protein